MNRKITADLLHIFNACISVIVPENLVRKSVLYDTLNEQLKVDNKIYDLTTKDLYLVGTGKAVQNMANEIELILSTKIKKGIISIPVGSFNNKFSKNNVCYYEGAENNLPDEKSLRTARKIKDLVSNLTDKDLLIVLISGGGSALLPLPKTPITLEDKCAFIKELACCGANIKELNTVRKKISEIKGGQLAIHAYPSQVISLILSDVIGDPIDLIASGPTCENNDDILAALNVVHCYKLYRQIPQSIKSSLECDHLNHSFPRNNVHNVIIGSNKLSVEAAMTEAKKLNYFPIMVSNIVEGNVKIIANEYVRLITILVNYRSGKVDCQKAINDMKSLKIPGLISSINKNKLMNLLTFDSICLIFGGETTVEVQGSGKGGRNQQLALEFSKIISTFNNQLQSYDIYLLSAGTDGIDGPTDAAGAIGYIDLVRDCEQANFNIDIYLDNNDCYNFYKNFMYGELHVITGHTNTNVMDIHLIIMQDRKV